MKPNTLSRKFRLDLIFQAKLILNLNWLLLSNTIFLDERIKSTAPNFVVCTVARHALAHGAQPTTSKYKLTESTVRAIVKSLKETQSNTDLETVPKRK